MSANPITKSIPKKKKNKSDNEDPTEADGRRWAKGHKYEFLAARLPLWHDARDLNEMSSFYTRVTLLFIRFFTWDRALDPDGNGPAEDPSEDNLNEVLEVAGLEPAEVERRAVIFMELRGKIQRWFRYHGTKALKSQRVDPLSKILAALKSQDKPPRRMQTLHFYSKLYYDTRIKPTVDAEWPKLIAQAGAKGLAVPKRLKHQNAAALKKQRDAEFDEEYGVWKAASQDPDLPKTAEDFAQALEDAATWLHPLAQSLSKRLGLNVSILLTGPMGSSGGRIDVKGVHAGESSGLVPKLWPAYDVHAYEALLKSLVGFAKACFSLEECRARALPGTVPADAESLSTRTYGNFDCWSCSVLRRKCRAAPASRYPWDCGSRSNSTPAMPSPLRMVSTLSARAMRASVPPNAAAEPIYGPPSMLLDVSRANLPPSSPVFNVGVTTPVIEKSSSAPNDPSPSSPSSLTTMPSVNPPPLPLSATPVSSTTRKKQPLPPPSSSPTAESPTPPTETSALPSSSPSPTLASAAKKVLAEKSAAKKVLAEGSAAASPRRMRASPAPASISAGPRTVRAPGTPKSISAGPTFGRTATRASLGRSASISAGPAPFSKINEKNCPSNIVDIIHYLKGHEWGPVWDHCVATWVEIERFAQFEAHGTLQNPTDGRPLEVPAWMKRARKLVDFPINNVDKFADGWLKWWNSNRPSSEGFDDVPANLDWAVLNVTGPNGLRLFMLTLAWWGAVVEDDQGSRGKWLLAVGDVRVVFDRVLLAAAKRYNSGEVDVDLDVDDCMQEPVSRKRQRGNASATPVKLSTKKRKVKNN
ncbi:hypothetical protein K466DRAFT_569297 [Polyporus arcularius HHB13444]|uniref:Uncharacterized protein n=1 Tax=Polyporus arcularius HHB13444 TaxID=1314778 RepID=A0A5C3NVF3_9APHY|nr:hypothetical protein K466DRAFT_569297 [Polyporus arcularius HHB13444]